MPWFAWLFVFISLPAVTWWALDEHRYNKHERVVVDDTLTALARAVGVWRD